MSKYVIMCLKIIQLNSRVFELEREIDRLRHQPAILDQVQRAQLESRLMTAQLEAAYEDRFEVVE